MVRLPENPGRLLLNSVAVRTAPLLRADDFAKYCGERALSVSRARLRRFEELGIVVPIVRVRAASDGENAVWLNDNGVDDHFDSGRVIDTSAAGADYEVPADDDEWMPYYSRFQILEVVQAINAMDMTVALDEYLRPSGRARIPQTVTDRWLGHASWYVEYASAHNRTRALAVLAQFISDRYLPHAQSNRRTLTVSPTSTFTQWLAVESMTWQWWEHVLNWDPRVSVGPFQLDQESLRFAYERVSADLRVHDPLWNWNDLITFVDHQNRARLREDALLWQAHRDLTEMLRLLYRDLYAENLPKPHEVGLPTDAHVPELAVRDDPREHLKYVANIYGVNPQPKAVLFVEGKSEIAFIQRAYPKLFGHHHGVSGIKLVNLHGVANATGGKSADRFNAIFRLLDYLHDEQIFTFVILDNEGRAQQLKEAAGTKRSLFGQRKYATKRSRVKIWRTNFEFDNFSDTEIARALTNLAHGDTTFLSRDVKAVRSAWRKQSLSGLFEARVGYGLEKPALAEQLAELMTAAETKRNPASRPIFKILEQASRKAARNWLPVGQGMWAKNQRFFG